MHLSKESDRTVASCLFFESLTYTTCDTLEGQILDSGFQRSRSRGRGPSEGRAYAILRCGRDTGNRSAR